jgi:hypothetical protein
MSVETITKQMYRCSCDREECGYKWEPESIPNRCPKCKSRRWNRAARISAKRMLTFNGDTLSIGDWGRKLGLSKTVIPWRLKQGWPMDQVLSKEDWRVQK